MDFLAELEGARTATQFARGLGCLVNRTAWTSGSWDFGNGDNRDWRAIQNVNRDIVTLAQHLISIVRADMRVRRSESADHALEREVLARVAAAS